MDQERKSPHLLVPGKIKLSRLFFWFHGLIFSSRAKRNNTAFCNEVTMCVPLCARISGVDLRCTNCHDSPNSCEPEKNKEAKIFSCLNKRRKCQHVAWRFLFLFLSQVLKTIEGSRKKCSLSSGFAVAPPRRFAHRKQRLPAPPRVSKTAKVLAVNCSIEVTKCCLKGKKQTQKGNSISHHQNNASSKTTALFTKNPATQIEKSLWSHFQQMHSFWCITWQIVQQFTQKAFRN